MHNAHGAEQSIDNGLDTNQGSLLPESLVIQISPFSLSHQKLASFSKNESFAEKINSFEVCVANQSNDIFAYANENSQFDRTDNNQFAKVPLQRNSNIFPNIRKAK